MACYSAQSRDYGFLSVTKNISKNVGKIIRKN